MNKKQLASCIWRRTPRMFRAPGRRVLVLFYDKRTGNEIYRAVPVSVMAANPSKYRGEIPNACQRRK